MQSSEDRAAVTAVLQAYFDGLHRSDVEGLRAIFWPEANLYAAPGGQMAVEARDVWLKRVAGRPNFAQQGVPAPGTVLDLHIAGPVACAWVTSTVPPTSFTDYLGLARAGGEWRIISKVYTAMEATG